MRRISTFLTLTILLVTSLIFSSNKAEAAVLTYQYSGSVLGFNALGNIGQPVDGITVGNPLTLTLRVDESVPDIGSGNQGVFFGLDLTLKINAFTWTVLGPRIRVFEQFPNGSNGGNVDLFSAFGNLSSGSTIVGINPNFLQFVLEDFESDLLDGADLPLVVPSTSFVDNQINRLLFDIQPGNVTPAIVFELDGGASSISAPPALSLMLIALGGILAFRRKSSGSYADG